MFPKKREMPENKPAPAKPSLPHSGARNLAFNPSYSPASSRCRAGATCHTRIKPTTTTPPRLDSIAPTQYALLSSRRAANPIACPGRLWLRMNPASIPADLPSEPDLHPRHTLPKSPIKCFQIGRMARTAKIADAICSYQHKTEASIVSVADRI